MLSSWCAFGIRYRYCDSQNSNSSTNTNAGAGNNSNFSATNAGGGTTTNSGGLTPGGSSGTNTGTGTSNANTGGGTTNTSPNTNQNSGGTINTNTTYTTPPTQVPTGTTIAIFNGSVSTQCSESSDCTIVDKTKDRRQCCYNQACTSFAGSQFVAVNISSLASLDSSVYDFQGCIFEQCFETPACSVTTQKYIPACVNNLCVKKSI